MSTVLPLLLLLLAGSIVGGSFAFVAPCLSYHPAHYRAIVTANNDNDDDDGATRSPLFSSPLTDEEGLEGMETVKEMFSFDYDTAADVAREMDDEEVDDQVRIVCEFMRVLLREGGLILDVEGGEGHADDDGELPLMDEDNDDANVLSRRGIDLLRRAGMGMEPMDARPFIRTLTSEILEKLLDEARKRKEMAESVPQ